MPSVRALAATLAVACSLIGLLPGCATAPVPQAPSSPTEPGPYADVARFASEVDLLASGPIAPDQVGFLLYDPETRTVLTSHRADAPFAPASVFKVLTTGAALEVLGENHRFATRVAVTGPVRGGVLRGDVYLVGGGDPRLGMEDVWTLAHDLRRAGVREVRGKFFYDDLLYPSRERIHRLRDAGESYNPGLSALSLDFNLIRGWWDRDAHVAFTVPGPPIADAAFDEHAESLTQAPAGESWQVPLDGPAHGVESLPVRDPGLYAARVFQQFARQQGIALPEPARGAAPARAHTLATHRGPPVVELCEQLLEHSNNLMAELLLLATARKLTGRGLTLEQAAPELGRWWRHKLPHLPWRENTFENGSGLSRQTQVDATTIVGALDYLSRRPGHPYQSLLPISGWKGTLGRRLLAPGRALAVWAKTGTLFVSSGLGGYLHDAAGHRRIFAIFVSRPNEDGDTRRWLEQARGLQDALVSFWIDHR
jgi:D-alanyl-D-alanine carboxypeptidase/D-alanyl-D-alanine-endopeptidase (penicillin-binding protein 4)